MEPLVKIENATVYRGGTRVFDDLSLTLDGGVCTAVLGPNGAGKTTLLKLISCELYPVDKGTPSVSVLGRTRWNVFELRSELGVVSHELGVAYQRDVRGLDVVLSGFFSSIGLYEHQGVQARQIDRARAAMRQLGIVRLEQQPICAMSAGEQRRCLLARALVHEPHTLLLDEPTTSLDLKSAFEVMTSLRQLARQGKTLVIVTHHVQEIPPEVGVVILLKEGSVFAQGEKHDILRSETLSALYDYPLEVVERRGFYQVYPTELDAT